MTTNDDRCHIEFEHRREREAIGEDRSHLRVYEGDIVRCDECGGEHVTKLGGEGWYGSTVMVVDCPASEQHAVAWPVAGGLYFERDEDEGMRNE